jgi:hypothetical protein
MTGSSAGEPAGMFVQSDYWFRGADPAGRSSARPGVANAVQMGNAESQSAAISFGRVGSVEEIAWKPFWRPMKAVTSIEPSFPMGRMLLNRM